MQNIINGTDSESYILSVTVQVGFCCFFVGVACPDPGTPANGRRQLESLQDGGTVHYSCYDGYTLVGEAKRTCRNGRWTGTLPACIGN